MGIARPVVLAVVALPVYGVAYLLITSGARVPEAAEFLDRISRVLRRAS
jgi:hypothetical protein